MQETGHIDIRISGTRGGEPLNPMLVDLAEIRSMLNDIETFLYPTRAEKLARPQIAYRIEEGSALHRFFPPLTAVLMFSAVMSEVDLRQSIDFLDPKQREIVDKMQRTAAEQDLTITFGTSNMTGPVLTITKDTKYYNAAPMWIKTDFLLYGEVYEEGGINPNLHIDTKRWGKLTVSATKTQLLEGERKLYKVHGVRASGKQSLDDGKPFDLKLESFLEYDPVFSEGMLDSLIQKARPNLSKIANVDEWLKQLRGGSTAHG